jgi:hypothetical protein
MASFFRNPSVTEVTFTAFLMPTCNASFSPEITSWLLNFGADGVVEMGLTYPFTMDKSTFEQVPTNKEIVENASILNMLNE